jgi:hypothetical protein
VTVTGCIDLTGGLTEFTAMQPVSVNIHNAMAVNPIVISCFLSLLSLPCSETRVYPKVSGLAAWSENCKWYSSTPLGTVVSLFCESV